ncbi:hypothetical protein [Mycobacteroides abscessus]|uniref:hypothetical protein n=1 Tax=Mycobacteroides abscessus TaxID=36809 RepID=UPI0009280BC5|nr:hypothetical protein [Mycobacteroides abscessus]SHW60307.1 Uncharacterised protein [Mycobacteroides abscessus subsp. abscessus]
MVALEVHGGALIGVARQLADAASQLAAVGASPPVHPQVASDEVSVSAAARLTENTQVVALRGNAGPATVAFTPAATVNAPAPIAPIAPPAPRSGKATAALIEAGGGFSSCCRDCAIGVVDGAQRTDRQGWTCPGRCVATFRVMGRFDGFARHHGAR